MADVFVQLKKAFDAGDMERARYLQGKGNGMIRTLLEIGIFPAIKGVLKLQGIDCGNCIKPFQPLRPEDYQKLEKALVDLYDGGSPDPKPPQHRPGPEQPVNGCRAGWQRFR